MVAAIGVVAFGVVAEVVAGAEAEAEGETGVVADGGGGSAVGAAAVVEESSGADLEGGVSVAILVLIIFQFTPRTTL